MEREMTIKGFRMEWGPLKDRRVRVGLSLFQAARLTDELRQRGAADMSLITSVNARIEGEYLIRAALRGVN
jgi:hypothetical protein